MHLKTFDENGALAPTEQMFNFQFPKVFAESEELTPSSQMTARVPYANSFDPDERPSNSASHPDPSCLIPRQHFHKL